MIMQKAVWKSSAAALTYQAQNDCYSLSRMPAKDSSKSSAQQQELCAAAGYSCCCSSH